MKKLQKFDNKRGSAIVITVSGKTEAKKLYTSGLQFGGVVKVVEKNEKSRPSLVYMTFCGIGHEQMGKCGDQVPKCVICASLHKIEDHQYGVTGCNKKVGKVCVYVIVQYANCGGSHSANSNRCTLRHKAEKEARKVRRLIKVKLKW